ncbi:MAG: hypothetical protein C4551_03190 [Bacillota bacterium]|nr:MAG: hypothetical protein C4551_03190 [Bacillota bacterium]
MGLLDEIRTAHQAWHAGGGREGDRVRDMVTELATVAQILHLGDGVYVRLQREGQTALSAPVRWADPVIPPAVNQRAQVYHPRGSMRYLDLALPPGGVSF